MVTFKGIVPHSPKVPNGLEKFICCKDHQPHFFILLDQRLNAWLIEKWATSVSTFFIAVVRFPNPTYGDNNTVEYFVQGHVEVLHDNTWGTVCSKKSWDCKYINSVALGLSRPLCLGQSSFVASEKKNISYIYPISHTDRP